MSVAQLNLSEGLSDLKLSVTSALSGSDQLGLCVKRYGLLEHALKKARTDEIITPLPDGEPSGSSDYARSRILTMRNRLANLGYLKSDSKRAVLDAKLKMGITRFQQDVAKTIDGFAVDGWIGDQSWTALQELVSFEDVSNIPRWFKEGEPSPALMRAIQLRLFALGLVEEKPGNVVLKLKPALQHFSEICRILKLSAEPVLPEVCPASVSLLFDQGEIVRRLAVTTAPTARSVRIKIHGFIMNVAKIELWMLGFGISPDGSDARPSPLRFKRGISISLDRNMDLKSNTPLYKALFAYWSLHRGDKTRARMPARMFAKTSFPLFFNQLLKDTVIEPVEVMDADQLYHSLETHQISMDMIWSQVESLGSRLWDGMKRLWGWFSNIVMKAVNFSKSFISSISRLTYQYILRSYESVKAVIRGFCASAAYLFNPDVKVVEGVKTVIRHDGDVDFKVIVHEGDRAADVRVSAGVLEIRGRIFYISSRILSGLIAVLKSITAGITGWAWLLLGLLKLYKRIALLAPELIVLQKRLVSMHKLDPMVEIPATAAHGHHD